MHISENTSDVLGILKNDSLFTEEQISCVPQENVL
jgi:hypothetical protein